MVCSAILFGSFKAGSLSYMPFTTHELLAYVKDLDVLIGVVDRNGLTAILEHNVDRGSTEKILFWILIYDLTHT